MRLWTFSRHREHIKGQKQTLINCSSRFNLLCPSCLSVSPTRLLVSLLVSLGRINGNVTPLTGILVIILPHSCLSEVIGRRVPFRHASHRPRQTCQSPATSPTHTHIHTHTSTKSSPPLHSSKRLSRHLPPGNPTQPRLTLNTV